MQLNLYGGLRLKGGGILLTIYSAPLARILMERNIKTVDVIYSGETIIIQPGSKHKLHFERINSTPIIPIYVGKILPQAIVNKIKNHKKTIKTKILIKDIAEQRDLAKYNKAIRYVIPDNDLQLNANDIYELSAHVTKANDSGPSYQIKIKHKLFEEIAKRKTKVIIFRKGNIFFVKRDDAKGIAFNLYKYPNGHPVIYAPIPPEIITGFEKTLFDKGRRSVKSRVCISPAEFNLELYNFFLVEEEQKLARELTNRNIRVSPPDMRIRSGDLLLRDYKSEIEITTIAPSNNKQKNGAHGSTGAHINARICEGYIWTKNKNLDKYFVVIDKSWSEYNWVNELIDLVKPNVNVLFTSFKKDWENKISEDVLKIIK